MIQSDYFDLAVGLAVVLFLGGLVVSGLNEGIGWLTRVRAKFLWAYLHDLFDTRTNRALPRGRLGITRLWNPANDMRPRAGGGSVTVDADVVPAADWLARLAYALDPVDAPELVSRGDEVRTAIKHVPPSSLAQAALEVFADIGRQEVTSAIGVIVGADEDPTAVDAAVSILTRRIELDPAIDLRPAVSTFRETLAQTSTGQTVAREAAADTLAATVLGDATDTGLRDAWRQVAVNWGAVTQQSVIAVVDATARVFPNQFARLRIDAALSKLDRTAPLAPTLRRLWEAAAGEIDEFRSALEKYFDADLKRLSGYYRRSIRVVMFGLAALFAVGGGLDAISLTRDLWRNPEARASLVQQADELDSSDPVTPTTAEAVAPPGAIERIQQECAEAHPPDETEIDDVSDAAEAYGKVRNCVNDALDELTGVAVLDQALWVDASAWGRAWSSAPLAHAAGTALAALGLMLGAPFWFDVIKRITGIRRGLIGDT